MGPVDCRLFKVYTDAVLYVSLPHENKYIEIAFLERGYDNIVERGETENARKKSALKLRHRGSWLTESEIIYESNLCAACSVCVVCTVSK